MNVFVARQPIFNKKNTVVAYELLFRNSKENLYNNEDGDKATLELITNSFSTIGIENIISGKKAFINFTENLLKQGIASVLPPNLVTVEILENVKPSEDVILACKNLKQQGYTLALDDFVFSDNYKELIKLADIIKVDFTITKGIERKSIIERINSKKVIFLAEKVETVEEFEEAISYGYTYFQGYYFSKPVILSGTDVPQQKFYYLKILKEINSENSNVETLEKLILRDVSLSYKLLKLLNSTAFGFKNKVKNINHAIALLGEKEVIKWLYLFVVKSMGENKPSELVDLALIRAKFAECIVVKTRYSEKSMNAYLSGMLSTMDAILDKPMKEIINEVSLPEEVSQALTGKSCFLHSILNLILAYEKAEWDKVNSISRELNITVSEMPSIYCETLKWVRDL
jgi:c-di-GMP-related signal transduction protein